MKVDADIHGNTKIWRYLDFEKFLDLLKNKRLYLLRSDLLSDKFEVTFPIDNQKSLEKHLEKEWVSESTSLETRKDSLLKQTQRLKKETFINSWTHLSEESFALWKIYLGSNPMGVVISTTVGKLKSELEKNKLEGFDKFSITKVKYSNYTDWKNLIIDDFKINKNEFIKRKNRAYSYEDEVRLFVNTINNRGKDGWSLINGFYIDLDIEKIIDEIIISPFMEDWFKDSFKLFLESLITQSNIKVRHSTIIDN